MELTTQQVSKVSTLAKLLAKAPIAASFGLIWGALSTLSQDTIALKVCLAVCGILLSACLWLFGQWIVTTKDLQLLRIAHAKSSEKKEDLSETAYSILCMIYDARDAIEDDDIQKRLGLSETDLDLALSDLFDGFIEEPNDVLDALRGYVITPKGIRYVKNRRNQDA
jgi:hypothetical protein